MKAHTNTQLTKAGLGLSQTTADFRNAVLIVSVLTNLFVLTTWLVIQASPTYALSLVSL